MTKAIKEADERLERYLKQMDEGDISEDGTSPSGGDTRLAEKSESIKSKRDHYGDSNRN